MSTYIVTYVTSDELYHHGIKGQKWGVRRYQNPDGSLTDEGRRRYGFGSEAGRLMTQNTKGRIKQGAKIGAGVGAGVGATLGTISAGILMSAGGPLSVATALGATYIANFAVDGALNGAGIGAVFGAVETAKGRQYIKDYDKGLAEFEKRDRKK